MKPVHPESLLDRVERQRAANPAGAALVHLPFGERAGRTVSYDELAGRARTVARRLGARARPGDPVLVLCPAGPDYCVALLACWYAHAIAVPAYPPARHNLARAAARIAAMVEDSGARVALSTQPLPSPSVHSHSAALERLEILDVDESVECDELEFSPPAPDMPALLQYTSGSTSTPKGVLLCHRHLAANLQMIRVAAGLDHRDVVLSWLPPFHDMGLVGGILLPLFLGGTGVTMPPEAFLRRPQRWLDAAQAHRATVLMAPNFAYELCARLETSTEARADLDLSAVRVAFNGAEPIAPATLDAFAQRFAACGLRPNALHPCYGMAEATLAISAGVPATGPDVRSYRADALELGRAIPCSELPQGTQRRLVGCGSRLDGEQLAIVHPETHVVLAEREVGEIWVSSASVALGYWQRPEETAATFHAHTNRGDGPFLRTGDLGFLDRGTLFVTGRLKDLIIVRGRNHYPHDIERTVQATDPALPAGAGAAFSVASPRGEALIVVHELDRRGDVELAGLFERIAINVRAAHDLDPAAIVLIRRGTLLKTSSGKVQRAATKRAFLSGGLQALASRRHGAQLDAEPAAS